MEAGRRCRLRIATNLWFQYGTLSDFGNIHKDYRDVDLKNLGRGKFYMSTILFYV